MYREFEEFVFNNYDFNEPAIKRKYYHSKRVSTISKKIAENLAWPLEDIKLATQIGLLHDMVDLMNGQCINALINIWTTDHTEHIS